MMSNDGLTPSSSSEGAMKPPPHDPFRAPTWGKERNTDILKQGIYFKKNTFWGASCMIPYGNE